MLKETLEAKLREKIRPVLKEWKVEHLLDDQDFMGAILQLFSDSMDEIIGKDEKADHSDASWTYIDNENFLRRLQRQRKNQLLKRGKND